MTPWRTLERAPVPGGSELVLQERAGEFVIRVDGHVLMTSRTHDSEEALAIEVCPLLTSLAAPRILIGGLGLGYTVRAALDRLPPRAQVVVAELVPAVIDWNRSHLAALAGYPLEDSRVKVVAADAGATIARTAPSGRFDAILLDIDNGPTALIRPENNRLYSAEGLATARAALAPGGILAVWSAGPDSGFAKRVRAAGFRVDVRNVPARRGAGARHTLLRAVRNDDPR